MADNRGGGWSEGNPTSPAEGPSKMLDLDDFAHVIAAVERYQDEFPSIVADLVTEAKQAVAALRAEREANARKDAEIAELKGLALAQQMARPRFCTCDACTATRAALDAWDGRARLMGGIKNEE